jgi:hypothetical protein
MELSGESADAMVPDDTLAGDDMALARSMAPDAPMNLLLRFETASGPRTVIACSVPRQVAREIAEVMLRCGQHADFIDRCAPLSISDRLMVNALH